MLALEQLFKYRHGRPHTAIVLQDAAKRRAKIAVRQRLADHLRGNWSYKQATITGVHWGKHRKRVHVVFAFDVTPLVARTASPEDIRIRRHQVDDDQQAASSKNRKRSRPAVRILAPTAAAKSQRKN